MAPPTRTETERTMLDRLNQKYGEQYRNGTYLGRKYSRAENVPNGMAFNTRRADFIAAHYWRSTGFEHIRSYHERYAAMKAAETGFDYALIGHEVKVSRSDWLHELKHPEKAEAWKQFCHEWYLVASSVAIVKDDLPEDWGLMVPNKGAGLRIVKKAPRLLPAAMPWENQVALLRASIQTETRIASAAVDEQLLEAKKVRQQAVNELWETRQQIDDEWAAFREKTGQPLDQLTPLG